MLEVFVLHSSGADDGEVDSVGCDSTQFSVIRVCGNDLVQFVS